MPIHAFSITDTVQTDEGLRLLPGVSMADDRPEVGEMIQGCNILLKTPDGNETITKLVNYGIGMVKLENGDFAMQGEPLIELVIDAQEDSLPEGTEVWIGIEIQ